MAEPRDPSHRPSSATGEPGRSLIAVVLVLIFILQNSQKVKVKFLFVDTTTPLIFAR